MYAVICEKTADDKRMVWISVFWGEGALNKVTMFISSISMEIYLSHMAIYRVVERLGLTTVIGSGLVQYIVTVIIVLCGTVLFAVSIHKGFSFISKLNRK